MHNPIPYSHFKRLPFRRAISMCRNKTAQTQVNREEHNLKYGTG